MRRAKIIATMGPVTSDLETVIKMIEAGVDVFRLNLSHSQHPIQAGRIKNVREASRITKREVAILMDLQGPKIRVDRIAESLQLNKDDIWVIGYGPLKDAYPEYKDCFIPTVYQKLVDDAVIGGSILFDDGLIEAQALERDRDVLKIRVKVGGLLKSGKGINLPDSSISASCFTEKDKKDLEFGIEQGIDYVALSFVKDAEDILKVKYMLHQLKKDIPIVAKIERPEAVRNIKKIAHVADVIMIARGDMGVELGNHKVPSIQKMIIDYCNEQGVPVITATQMLESMINNSSPTRAEASDIANAIWDGTDAVMLSGETSVGQYPLKAITIMGQIIDEAEKIPKDRVSLKHLDLTGTSASVQVAASLVAEKVRAKWVVCFSKTGNSAKKMARFRSKTKVLGVSNDIAVVRKMSIYWGITPHLIQEESEDPSFLEKKVIADIRAKESLLNGDKVVFTYGDKRSFSYGSSNSIRVEMIKDIPVGTELGGQKDLIDVAEFGAGFIKFNPQLCTSCDNCVEVCPHDIWKQTPNIPKLTFINRERVEECDLDMKCVEVCPSGAIEITRKNS